MKAVCVKLFKARDAEDSYALGVDGDPEGTWRARSGFGQVMDAVWSLELQSQAQPDVQTVEWGAVLERAVEAYQLSDPVITNFEWPLMEVK